MRRDGKSLGQMARDEIGPVGGVAALLAVFSIMIILLAVLALVVVNALAQSPWGTFSLAMTIPIAFFMGFYLRVIRPGRVMETTDRKSIRLNSSHANISYAVSCLKKKYKT